MYLFRLLLDLRCREARRDVADPYELHSTLCRAFSPSNDKCAPGTFLWRLEPERVSGGRVAKVLVQSGTTAAWERIGVKGWLWEDPEPPLDLFSRLRSDATSVNKQFRYRIRANPSVFRAGKRLGLLNANDQNKWLERQGARFGFILHTCHASDERMLTGNRRSGPQIRIFSVLFDGILQVKAPESFRNAVENGIGHGKALGLGLLSVVPVG